jgi:ubiquinone/menaquinone biosynthesis C-methylase UbiE
MRLTHKVSVFWGVSLQWRFTLPVHLNFYNLGNAFHLKKIMETDFSLLVDFYVNAPHQGPGSEATTRKALAFTALAHKKDLQIADIGCGTGSSALLLAKALNGQVTAVDIFPEFLQTLEVRAKSQPLKATLRTLAGDMNALPFAAESLDLIWAEGSVYNIGFAEGVKKWSAFLKPQGYLAVSEIIWTTPERPEELEQYWAQAYAEMGNAADKINALEAAGYAVKGYFPLPSSDWEAYHQPLEAGFEAFLARNPEKQKAAAQIIEETKYEIALFRKYPEHCTYGFFVAQKR